MRTNCKVLVRETCLQLHALRNDSAVKTQHPLNQLEEWAWLERETVAFEMAFSLLVIL